MRTVKNTPIYLPDCPLSSAAERWTIVAAALRAAGFTDLRQAPPASLSFRPRSRREG